MSWRCDISTALSSQSLRTSMPCGISHVNVHMRFLLPATSENCCSWLVCVHLQCSMDIQSDHSHCQESRTWRDMEVTWQDGGTGASGAAFLESSLPVLPKFTWLEILRQTQKIFQGKSPTLGIFVLLESHLPQRCCLFYNSSTCVKDNTKANTWMLWRIRNFWPLMGCQCLQYSKRKSISMSSWTSKAHHPSCQSLLIWEETLCPWDDWAASFSMTGTAWGTAVLLLE